MNLSKVLMDFEEFSKVTSKIKVGNTAAQVKLIKHIITLSFAFVNGISQRNKKIKRNKKEIKK